MSQNLHNLDENVTESFGFILGGVEYQMKYPTTEEIQAISDIETQKEDGKTDSQAAKKQEKLLMDLITPDFSEAYKKMNVKQLRTFNTMIFEEFGVEDKRPAST